MERQFIREQWRPVAEFNGEYEVSNLGRVRSMKRYRGQTGRIMPQTQQPSGRHGERRYFAVMFSMNNKQYCRKVHRLVAEAFIPNPDHLPQINHIDGDKANNQVSNLEWCTGSYNMKHAIRTGLANPKAHAHHWTDEEKEQIRQQRLSYFDRVGRRNTKPHRTRAEYQAERKRKAEERRAIEAAKPRRPRGRPRKNK